MRTTLTLGPEFGPAPDDIRRMRSILDAAEARGIQVALCHAHSRWQHLTDVGEEQYRRDCRAAIDQLGAHPAVFGFHVGDEPFAKDFSDACRAMRIQQELAPGLSPFLNLMSCQEGWQQRVGFTSWAEYLDAYVAQARPRGNHCNNRSLAAQIRFRQHHARDAL